MPTIVDANCCAKAFSTPPDPEFAPIAKALFTRRATLVCGGRLQREYLRVNVAARALKTLEQAGVLKILDPQAVDKLEYQLAAQKACVSDDQHVIAIAQLANARLLCSHDQALHHDFLNKQLIDHPRGSVYQDSSHGHLIPVLGM